MSNSVSRALWDAYDKLVGGAYIVWLYVTGRLND